MNSVNPYYIHSILDPLAGGADDDEQVEQYRGLDPNNEAKVREIIRLQLKPYFLRFDSDSSENAKRSLKYYLNDPKCNFDRIFNSNLPPFGHPNDPRQFFIWLWEELFPGESWHLENLSGFTVKQDINVTWKIRLTPDENQKQD